MYIIVGLGNPGTKYEGTRHNMGFDVIDALIERNKIPSAGTKFHALYGTGRIGAEKVVLAKPLTYMNLSGTAVREITDFYKIDVKNELIVISDDIDLEPGRLRIRKKGSAGGQNGLKDIIGKLGTEEFVRIRVGTGSKPAGWDLADWVLGQIPKEDQEIFFAAMGRVADALPTILDGNFDKAMNLLN
jgi:PTH1 family peptidyl-tRNA hydrolase